MSKKIEFTYDDELYTLEFNRDSVKKMEDHGFNIAQAENKVVSTIDALFKGAFEMHHSGTSKKKLEEIYDLFSDKTGLFEALVEMYSDTLKTLTEDNNSKNAIKWTKMF